MATYVKRTGNARKKRRRRQAKREVKKKTAKSKKIATGKAKSQKAAASKVKSKVKPKNATTTKAKPKKAASAKAKRNKITAAATKAKPKKTATTKAKPKKTAATKAKPKKVAATKAKPKKTVKPRTVKKTKEQIARELRAVRSQLAKLIKAQQKARHTPKKSPKRTEARQLKKKISERRVKKALVAQNLPRATPKEKRESKLTNFDRMRRRFRELLNLAERTGQTPSTSRILRRVDSRYIIGEQRQVRIQRILGVDAVEDIIYKVNRVGVTMTGIYPTWHARISFSVLGDRLLGSGGRVLEIKGDSDPDASSFQTEGYDSSGAWNSYEGMMDSLETLLESYANTPNTVVYLHFVKLLNFSRKRG